MRRVHLVPFLPKLCLQILFLAEVWISTRNRSAENLFGWKYYEVLGKSVAELLISEEHHVPLKKIMERLSSGQSWLGQFPFKKRSGEIFMAIVTKNPLYEDGEIAGIVTVSSDAAILNSTSSENLRTHPDSARVSRINLKRIQWNPRLPIAPASQIASSVSNLVLMYYIIGISPIFSCLILFSF